MVSTCASLAGLRSGGAAVQMTFGTPTLFVPYRSRDGRLFTVGDIRLGELQRFDPVTQAGSVTLMGYPPMLSSIRGTVRG